MSFTSSEMLPALIFCLLSLHTGHVVRRGQPMKPAHSFILGYFRSMQSYNLHMIFNYCLIVNKLSLVSLAGWLLLCRPDRLAWSSQHISCLCLLCIRIKDVCHNLLAFPTFLLCSLPPPLLSSFLPFSFFGLLEDKVSHYRFC